jgi:hypothetical protein
MISDSPAPGDDRPIPESGSILLRDVLCPHCLRTDGHEPSCPRYVAPPALARLRAALEATRATLDRLIADVEAAEQAE